MGVCLYAYECADVRASVDGCACMRVCVYSVCVYMCVQCVRVSITVWVCVGVNVSVCMCACACMCRGACACVRYRPLKSDGVEGGQVSKWEG